MDNSSFSPVTATVPTGATATWTNHDEVPHNIVSTGQKFYKCFCSIHPKMTGRIVVGDDDEEKIGTLTR